jgi:hypothetical protein
MKFMLLLFDPEHRWEPRVRVSRVGRLGWAHVAG